MAGDGLITTLLAPEPFVTLKGSALEFQGPCWLSPVASFHNDARALLDQSYVH